jgi:pimeloyl-ACP methyl ester carboxylesterase
MTDLDYVSMMKSTIVRSYQAPGALRAAGGILSAAAPSLAARLAESMFLTPPRHRRPAAEAAVLASAHRATVDVEGLRIATWTWGDGGPVALLVHGWGGRGAQLASFVDPLLARGFAVTAFDAPGHGDSEGHRVTLPRVVAAIRAVAAAGRPVRAIVAHSMGAAATTRALYEGLGADAAVFIGPPAEMVTPSVVFAEALGLSPRVRALLQERVERRVGMPWSAFDVTRLAPSLAVPLLVVHDRDDAEVPWQHGDAIARAWPGATLLTTDALGHRRILRAPEVVRAVVEFVAARVPGESARGQRSPIFSPAGKGASPPWTLPSCARTGPQYVGPWLSASSGIRRASHGAASRAAAAYPAASSCSDTTKR